GGESESWAEFIRNLGDVSLQGKTVALFGLGDQRGYPDNFASGLRPLYDALRARGATMIGSWPNEGYEFSASSALEGERFVGLVLDQDNQFDETETRLATWLEEIKPHLL
ncbi:MAG: flavodoxin, partial [Klebsiella sp.]|nr:flavodoxin [Klebsiella sp.]MDU2481561.1 flavodoxin [Klebsiella sp.]MDU2543140.1 flavodoxin [Klebsiella sp.]